jgi:hypothetical protein
MDVFGRADDKILSILLQQILALRRQISLWRLPHHLLYRLSFLVILGHPAVVKHVTPWLLRGGILTYRNILLNAHQLLVLVAYSLADFIFRVVLQQLLGRIFPVQLLNTRIRCGVLIMGLLKHHDFLFQKLVIVIILHQTLFNKPIQIISRPLCFKCI